MVQQKSRAERKGDAQKMLTQLGRVDVLRAADLLDLHPYTIRDYINRGFIRYIMVGKRPWILPDEIERFQREGKLSPEAAFVEESTDDNE